MSESDSDATTLGWALRHNGSCLQQEEYCGATRNPYRACCPGGSYCPRAYNVACCPSSLNCTEALQARPVCANQTWDLYYNGGYFCCEQGTRGYATSFNSNGCGEQGYELVDSETLLSIIVTGTTSTPTPAPTGFPQLETESSKINVGAITGGVVGGVAGAALIVAMIWFLFFRTRRRKQQPEGVITHPEDPKKEYPAHYTAQSADSQLGSAEPLPSLASQDGQVKPIVYDKLVDQFGTKLIDDTLLERFKRVTGHKPHRFLHRQIVFSHRDLDLILAKYEKNEPVFIYTGRGPSSNTMHIGHIVPFVLTKWLSDVFEVPVVVMLTDGTFHAPTSLTAITDDSFLLADEKYLIGTGNRREYEYEHYAHDNSKDIIRLGSTRTGRLYSRTMRTGEKRFIETSRG
ncbi:hypothetical protein BJX99DRAFT_261317 [Aspergillus californicus]